MSDRFLPAQNSKIGSEGYNLTSEGLAIVNFALRIGKVKIELGATYIAQLRNAALLLLSVSIS